MSNQATNTAAEVTAMQAEIAKLRAERDALAAKAAAKQRVTYKVSAKGAISVYGLGRFPVTLYATQWAALFAHKAAIEDFAVKNRASLAVKGE